MREASGEEKGLEKEAHGGEVAYLNGGVGRLVCPRKHN